MLSEYAIDYYKQGYSCSRCIMKAAEAEYSIITGDTIKALGGISNGLGIGAMCSIPITCVLVLGLIYNDENILKQKRLSFLIAFKNEFGTINCSELQKHYTCEQIIIKGCNILSTIIEK